MVKLSRFLLPVMFLVAVAGIALAADESKIIAVYGNAASVKNPPPGWSFMWNANGPIGDSNGYLPLSYDDKSKMYGVINASGTLMADRPNNGRYLDIISLRDKDGVARFYIASYTMQTDSTGEIWINNGNIRNKFFAKGTMLEIYLNNKLQFTEQIKQDRFARLFQKNLGKLKKGDAITVAVGPGEKSDKGGGRLHFIIEEYPAGQKPGEPVNIISPPITAAEPQRGTDGKIDKGYSDKHKAQCAEVLTNNPELVFAGDSITARWPMELLRDKFGKYRPVNLGIGGDWVQNVRWRIRNGVLDQVHPKVFVVMIGTNNISGGFTTDEIVEGIGLLIKDIYEKAPGSKILLYGIFPRGAGLKDQKHEMIRQINAKLALMADNKKIFYMDIGDKLVEPDGSISTEMMKDRLHIGLKGYKIWEASLTPVIDKMMGNN
jgi:beta-glucosidase